MEILITGAEGFIGKNLKIMLERDPIIKISTYTKFDNNDSLKKKLLSCDVVVHLAGVNRPEDIRDHYSINHNLTREIIKILQDNNKVCDFIFTSSIQVNLDNPYGKSKKMAEKVLIEYKKNMGANVYIYRLPNIFGKWSKPNYNSVVATFCYNISRNIPIKVHDSKKEIELLYIDDLVLDIFKIIQNRPIVENGYCQIPSTYKTTIGEIADKIYSFKAERLNLMLPNTSNEFIKKLYSTYLSYLPIENFKYDLNMHIDERGSFTEILKMKDFGQVSINVSKQGIVKGNHWHKTKVEKFLVVKGKAKITFKNYFNNNTIDYYVDDKKYEIVDIPPGYSHSITNIGEEDLVTVIWANEIYSDENPDTYR